MSEQEYRQVEVWLTLNEDRAGVTGRLIFDDETSRPLLIDARSIQGAEREVTAWLIERGYAATAASWEIEAETGDDALEVSRTFKAAGPDAKDIRPLFS